MQGDKPNNYMIIGLGHHARRIYYPVFKKFAGEWNVHVPVVVDLESQKHKMESCIGEDDVEIVLIPDKQSSSEHIAYEVETALNDLVAKYDIKGVVISTDPTTHVVYAKWALKKGLSILMDKPISSREGVAYMDAQALKLVEDYKELHKLYVEAQKKNPNVLFSLMAQRRYHKAFHTIRDMIKEVYQQTNCPITSLQSFHNDGMWRLPHEITDFSYHPYNQGYGKVSHSGYHFYDIAWWLINSANKGIDNVDITANFLMPSEHLEQLSLSDYKNLFPEYRAEFPYDRQTLLTKMDNCGEIDAFSQFAFKRYEKTITLASINLTHSGFSQRGWFDSTGKDLYKGNGRVRHESHYIAQGPFQAISYVSYQAKEIQKQESADLYDVGGEYHLDIHVFRNNSFKPDWKPYEKISVKDLDLRIMEGYSRGHQEDARKNAVEEFVRHTSGEKIEPLSDFYDHFICVQLISGVYQSVNKRRLHKNPLVNLGL